MNIIFANVLECFSPCLIVPNLLQQLIQIIFAKGEHLLF